MESKRKIQHQGTFECELCGLTAPYSYFGQKPPNVYSAALLEECYVMTDPFTSDKDKFLILGSQCSLCHKCVCVGTFSFHEWFSKAAAGANMFWLLVFVMHRDFCVDRTSAEFLK